MASVIGGKTGTGYKRFKQIEPPAPPPKPRRGSKPLALSPEWPNCQHGLNPPGACHDCHPRELRQHYG